MSWSRTVPAALLGVMLATCAVAPAEATYPGGVGRLVTGITVGTTPDIYSFRPDGSGLRQLTDDPSFDACASSDASGRMIAFCSDRTGPGSIFEIWTMRSDGSCERQLTRLNQRALFPDFSPSGREVVFDVGAAPGAPTDIWIVGNDGRGARPLTSTPDLSESLAVWSPDGRRIAFLKSTPGTGVNQVWIMDRDGRHQRQLTFDAEPKGQLPDWRPDGKQLAYSAGAGNFDTYLVNPDGSGQRNITNTPDVDETGTAWSPDGRRIAYLNFLERRVYTMRADGSDVRAAGPATGLQFVPGWQPESNRHW